MVLDRIEKTGDIRKLSAEELEVLPREIRRFLITHIAKTGGHLASNLGTVELTIALHLVLDLPEDKLVWDVGHQSYTHKILTGRKDGFDRLRMYGGLSGFPKPAESDADCFGTGHASTSISAALGFVRARELTGADYRVVAVTGDGALTGGLAYEALNNAASLHSNLTIVLNDNKMSIDENVGGLAMQLASLRTSTRYTGLKESIQNSLEKIPGVGDILVSRIRKTKNGVKQLVVPGMIFEEMGIMYLGPVDGHNIHAMTEVFRKALSYKGPVIVHCITKKGMGYRPAENHPARFHGAAPFDLATGLPLRKKGPGYTDIFSTVMRKEGARNPRVVCITAAMGETIGLKRFRNLYPDRYFDVGIAEEHAVTFAAALAAAGMIPVFAVYSTFLQRAYDEILHDVCLQNLHVVFCIDRAGISGPDGETHQGIFDLSFLTGMPHMTVMAPKNKWELSDMIKFAIASDGPVAIRYPKGEAVSAMAEHRAPVEEGKCEVLAEGGEILLFAIGSMVDTAVRVRRILLDSGIQVSVVNARFASPLDRNYLIDAAKQYRLIVTLEENVRPGGFGEHVLSLLNEDRYKGDFMNVSLPDAFIPQGTRRELLRVYGLDAVSISDRIRKWAKEHR